MARLETVIANARKKATTEQRTIGVFFHPFSRKWEYSPYVCKQLQQTETIICIMKNGMELLLTVENAKGIMPIGML